MVFSFFDVLFIYLNLVRKIITYSKCYKVILIQKDTISIIVFFNKITVDESWHDIKTTVGGIKKLFVLEHQDFYSDKECKHEISKNCI